jgi:RNA polymerase sigma-70 factor (ECF subfamily)
MFLRSAWHQRGQNLDDDWEEMMTGSQLGHGSPTQPEQAIDLDAALGNLPAVSRTVVWLHDVEGYTHKEIAALLGKSESFSKSQLSRAYQKLRPMLSAELDRTDSATELQGSVLGNC